ncbi:hypothetical protein Patl1_36071 [Pistacia atlantica]|nr:hypothetical protein Patl1_36071 [Pistacia atlantica]
MATNSPYLSFSLLCLAALSSGSLTIVSHAFSIKEATIRDIHLAFQLNKLTSRQLVEFYLGEIHRRNPILKRGHRDGFEKLMKENKLDAVVTPGIDMVDVLAIGGFPGIIVPGGYDGKGKPFGIYFGGLKGSEPKLIEIAYGFELATKIRKPPSFKP